MPDFFPKQPGNYEIIIEGISGKKKRIPGKFNSIMSQDIKSLGTFGGKTGRGGFFNKELSDFICQGRLEGNYEMFAPLKWETFHKLDTTLYK